MILHKIIKFLSKAFLINPNSQNKKFFRDLSFFIIVNFLAGTLAWCLAWSLGRIQDRGRGFGQVWSFSVIVLRRINVFFLAVANSLHLGCIESSFPPPLGHGWGSNWVSCEQHWGLLGCYLQSLVECLKTNRALWCYQGCLCPKSVLACDWPYF